MDLIKIGKLIIYIGISLIFFGLLISILGKCNLDKLPGNFIFKKGNFTIYFPLTISIILSIIFTLILNIIFRKS